jgi:hypothetical protein
MNKADLKIIRGLYNETSGKGEEIQTLIDAAQEKFDAKGEKAQEGEKGQELQEEIENLTTLHEALEALEEAFNNFSFDD